jgi:hypothetical protein
VVSKTSRAFDVLERTFTLLCLQVKQPFLDFVCGLFLVFDSRSRRGRVDANWSFSVSVALILSRRFAFVRFRLEGVEMSEDAKIRNSRPRSSYPGGVTCR